MQESGKKIMIEGNYQQLSHTFIDFCSSQEQYLMFLH